jgi:hypothetical protein
MRMTPKTAKAIALSIWSVYCEINRALIDDCREARLASEPPAQPAKKRR